MEKETVKNLIDKLKPFIKEYLKENGITKPLFNCLNPNHPDRHPSMSYIKSSMTVYCHACKERYSIIDLLGIEKGLGPHLKGKEFIEVLKYGCEKYGIEYPEENPYQTNRNSKSYLEQCYENRNNTDYFKQRGLSKNTINKFKLGYDPKFKINQNQYIKAAIIPTSQNTYTARNTENSDIRYRRSPGPTHIFNIQAIKNNLPIIITEGEFDALSLLDAGFNAIALSGLENIQKLIDSCIENNYQSTLLIALDNDKSGQKASIKLKNSLDKFHIRNKIIQPYETYKDANQMYIKDSTKLTIILAKEVRTAIKNEKIEQHCQKILKIYKELNKEQQKKVDQYIENVKELY